jgi:hypothetical protein
MAVVPNIRVNVGVPFPALVTGGSGITITKVNGVWTIGQSVPGIISAIAPSGIVPCFAGTGLLDFGAFPGGMDAQLVISGQTTILAGSTVEAFLLPTATADHTVDEHWVDAPVVMAGNIVAGQGFTIYGRSNDAVFSHGKFTVGWRWQ